MFFDLTIGQNDAKQRLLELLRQDRIPHALMLNGKAGAGKLPLAVGFAQALLCEHPQENGMPCGECLSCRMTAILEHPDLHFSFPVINKANDTQKAVSDLFIKEWRQQLLQDPYFDLNDWLEAMGAQTQQAQYYVAESDAIQRKLALKASQGGRKVMLIWLPEKMNSETANKLLKLLEEPPFQTHFILVTEDTENVLTTIRSRTQPFHVAPLSAEEIEAALISRGLTNDAHALARLAHGSMTAALHLAQPTGGEQDYFEFFVMLMRFAYARKVKDMREWANSMSGLGREQQKQFCSFAQHMLRENFFYNFRNAELNYQTTKEEEFSKKFARFINEKNIIPLTDLFTRAENDIAGNVNSKMVFFDTALQLTRLITPQ